MAAKSTPSKSPKDERSGFGALPYEPKGKPKAPVAQKSSPKPASSPKNSRSPRNKTAQGIPEAVSKRMAKRMAIFCGIPTLLGLSTFPLSYFAFFQNGIELPNVAVLLASLGCLGLGVLGLSYGVLSASWDEALPGSRIGWHEFTLNCGRLVENFKASRDRQNS
ncbi:photosystem II biosynthesis protein [Altericista sp. CCNU0014]|uniref:photosystem II biosynthesis protein n=1 Tax=Altericista sp. CCNU0014 TaxID=3082949 RepID=UPI0038504B59